MTWSHYSFNHGCTCRLDPLTPAWFFKRFGNKLPHTQPENNTIYYLVLRVTVQHRSHWAKPRCWQQCPFLETPAKVSSQRCSFTGGPGLGGPPSIFRAHEGGRWAESLSHHLPPSLTLMTTWKTQDHSSISILALIVPTNLPFEVMDSQVLGFRTWMLWGTITLLLQWLLFMPSLSVCLFSFQFCQRFSIFFFAESFLSVWHYNFPLD